MHLNVEWHTITKETDDEPQSFVKNEDSTDLIKRRPLPRKDGVFAQTGPLERHS